MHSKRQTLWVPGTKQLEMVDEYFAGIEMPARAGTSIRLHRRISVDVELVTRGWRGQGVLVGESGSNRNADTVCRSLQRKMSTQRTVDHDEGEQQNGPGASRDSLNPRNSSSTHMYKLQAEPTLVSRGKYSIHMYQ